MEIKIKKIDNTAILPEYNNRGEDAGLDLYTTETKTLAPGEYKLFKTGVAISIPQGYAGFINPRSGLALKYGITVLNADGVIDPGYRGEIGVVLINHSQKEHKIKKDDRIAQLIIQKYETVVWQEVDQLSTTTRGEDGYGSSGK